MRMPGQLVSLTSEGLSNAFTQVLLLYLPLAVRRTWLFLHTCLCRPTGKGRPGLGWGCGAVHFVWLWYNMFCEAAGHLSDLREPSKCNAEGPTSPAPHPGIIWVPHGSWGGTLPRGTQVPTAHHPLQVTGPQVLPASLPPAPRRRLQSPDNLGKGLPRQAPLRRLARPGPLST